MLCISPIEHAANVINFDKKNIAINKKTIKIAPKCNRLLYLSKKSCT